MKTSEKKMKEILNNINEIYEYYKMTKILPPRGNGAKIECAKEVHQVVKKLLKKYSRVENQEAIALSLFELCEQMILDNIDEDLTVEEVMLYDEYE